MSLFNKDMPKAVIKVTDVHTDWDGVYFRIIFPISFNAFVSIREELEDRGLKLKTKGGSGSGTTCSFDFGSFKTVSQAKEIIDELRSMIILTYENEQKYVKEFKALEGEYPVN